VTTDASERPVEETLLGIQRDFGWPVRAESFEVIDSWERTSSNAVFHRLSAPGLGHELLVKTDPRWSPTDAKNIHLAMADLDRIVADAGIEGAATIPSLGWAATPPMVVMPWIEAEELITFIRAETAVEDLRAIALRAGAMLAAYHNAGRVDDDRAKDVARSATITLAGKLPGGGARASALIDRLEPHRYAPSYGDVTPGNFLVARDGRLLLIDPPIETKPALIHRDLGYFLFELRKHFAGRGGTRMPGRPGYDEARTAFLEGYSGKALALADADHRLIALYEARQAAGTVTNRLPARPLDAMWFAGQAARSAARFLGRRRSWGIWLSLHLLMVQ
jgi:hypothetical protein